MTRILVLHRGKHEWQAMQQTLGGKLVYLVSRDAHTSRKPMPAMLTVEELRQRYPDIAPIVEREFRESWEGTREIVQSDAHASQDRML